jgi:type IV pilus secretin PilQ/predicted competence protein
MRSYGRVGSALTGLLVVMSYLPSCSTTSQQQDQQYNVQNIQQNSQQNSQQNNLQQSVQQNSQEGLNNNGNLNADTKNSEFEENISNFEAAEQINNAVADNAVINEAVVDEVATNVPSSAINNASSNVTSNLTGNLSSNPLAAVTANSVANTSGLNSPSPSLNTATPMKATQKQVDLGPPHGVVHWVGYNFKKEERKLDVQIVTDGKPIYKVFQEFNQAKQPEIVVRFLNTDVRHKIRRDIDASEFRSPVAYIRMRKDSTFRHADVILTMRDAVQPVMSVRGSSVMLSFAVPERWLPNTGESESPVATMEIASDANVMPVVASDSDPERMTAQAMVTEYVNDPGKDTFEGDEQLETATLVPIEGTKELVPQNPAAATDSLLPVSDEEAMPNFSTPGLNGGDAGPVHPWKETEFRAIDVAQEVTNFATDIPPPVTNGATNGSAMNGSAELTNGFATGGTVMTNEALVTEDMPMEGQFAADVPGIDPNAGQAAQQAMAAPRRAMKFDFRNATVGAVMRVISAESGLNFVMPPEVSARKITISLTNVSWDVALKAVLESNRLGMEEVGPKIVRIDDLKVFIDDRDAQDKARQATEALIPTKVLVMRLSYAQAEDAAKVVEKLLPKPADASSPAQKRNYDRFKVQADKRSNALIVEAIPTEIAKIKALIERLDSQTPQVKISSRIVEVLSRAERGLGISWDSPFNVDAGRGLGFGSLPFPNSLSSSFAVDPGMRGTTVGAAQIRLGSINNLMALDLKVKMLESKSEAESLQNQDVLVEDNQEASIVAGTSDYFTIQGTSTTPGSITEVAYNTSLKVVPHITADGSVQMKLDIKGDSARVSTNPNAAAGKMTRSLATTLLKKSGDTAVIGGLYSTDRQKTQNGIPWLSSLPIIGALFRSSYTTDERRDLLIMVTPTIQNSVSMSGFDAGGGVGNAAGSTSGNVSSNVSIDAAPSGNMALNAASNNQAIQNGTQSQAQSQFQGQGQGQASGQQSMVNENWSENQQNQGQQEQGNTVEASDNVSDLE